MISTQKGHCALEFAFFLPYLLFIFVGTFDCGFYTWALLCTENAARVAALYTSSSSSTAADSTTACAIATAEMADAPNIAANPSIITGSGGTATCTGSPLTVTATSLASGADGGASSQVTVTYQTPTLIPMPGQLAGQMSITRVVEMKVRQ